MKKYLSLKEIKETFGISKSAVYAWVKQRGFPPPITLSRRKVLWDRDDIERWIQSHRKEAKN